MALAACSRRSADSSGHGRSAPPTVQRWTESADARGARPRQRKSTPVVPDLRWRGCRRVRARNGASLRFYARGHGPRIPRRLPRQIQRSRNHQDRIRRQNHGPRHQDPQLVPGHGGLWSGTGADYGAAAPAAPGGSRNVSRVGLREVTELPVLLLTSRDRWGERRVWGAVAGGGRWVAGGGVRVAGGPAWLGV